MKNTGIQKGERPSIVKARVWLVHIACLGAIFTPIDWSIFFLSVGAFFIRVFIWEAGSHRYFSHRAFKTSRAFQLTLAALAAAAAQRGPIWWATKHRAHHRYSDQPSDIHSPVQRGFWFAHVGWVLDKDNLDTNLDAAKDLSRFPELVWINKYHYVFPYFLMVITYITGEYTSVLGRGNLGLEAVIWLFFRPTALSLHATFIVNTLVHGRSVGFFNRRRYHTSDTTTNSWLLSIPTLGASWHNNHHRYMNSARAGFYWWELDLTYIGLRLLKKTGLIWDLKSVPQSVLAEGLRYSSLDKQESRKE